MLKEVSDKHREDKDKNNNKPVNHKDIAALLEKDARKHAIRALSTFKNADEFMDACPDEVG